MPDNNKTVFHWSSGKDSALALYYLQQDSEYKIDHLVTSVNQHYQRVTMHGTPISLLQKQIEAIGLTHSMIELPENPSMEEYEKCMGEAMNKLHQQGFRFASFGDIFLEDLKAYREREMESLDFKTIFPLWKKDTKSLITEFIRLGFKAVVVCANDAMGEQFLGRTIDQAFVDELPVGIDPCGENGEFHTFCYDGPIFRQPVPFGFGKKIKRSYPNPSGDGSVEFWFIDLNE